MTKHSLSSIIVGIFFILSGIVLTILGLFKVFEGALVTLLIYGIPCLIIGIALLLWKKEDEIEQRKDMVNKKVKGGSKK